MTKRTNKTREKLTEMFLDILESAELKWTEDYVLPHVYRSHNPITETTYKGVNRFLLTLVSMQRGYEDPRWCTFKQLKDKNWRLNDAKGKGVPCEYWMPFHKGKKKSISWKDYYKLSDEEKNKYYLIHKTYTVFNFAHIEGCPELKLEDEYVNDSITQTDAVSKLIKGMEIECRESEKFTVPAYNIGLDCIKMPPQKWFKSVYEYNSCLLHELAHASGHPSRLNRPSIYNSVYEFEELVAEMSAAYTSTKIKIDRTGEHLQNHKAYVQGWIKNIKDKPEFLTKAIAEAEKVADYFDEIILQKTLVKSANELPKTLEVEISEDGLAKEVAPVLGAQYSELTPVMEEELDI